MEQQTTPPPPPPERRLERSRDDRILSGVCGGIARYFGVDATIVRITTVALTLLGGAGVLLYLAALLLMPEEGADRPSLSLTGEGRTQAATAIGIIVLALAGVAALAVAGAVIGWILLPLAFLVVAGMLAWWLASGQRPQGSPGQILKVSALGLVLLVLCAVLALGGAWAAGTGSGAVGAGLVIGAGVVLVAAAFVRPARWLILPALSLGLAAGFVTAAGIDLDGGIGEREYRPASATDVRDRYQLGIGELVIDLRDTELPPGDRAIRVDIGVGHALLVVPEDVCVTTRGQVGMGAVDVFDRENGGIDIDVQDSRSAPGGTPRIVLDGDVGIGLLEVAHDRFHGHGPRWNEGDSGGNDACDGRNARAGSLVAPVG